jgi:hypothetical protein
MDNEGAAMRQQMDKTLADLTGKLVALEHQVLGTVSTVKDSVNTVRETLDIKLQVRRRPWTLVVAAMVLGFLGGFRSSNRGAGRSMQNGKSPGTPPAPDGADAARFAAAASPSLFANLGGMFQPEIAALRGIAVGALLELVREVITKQESKPRVRPAGGAKNGGNGHAAKSSRPESPHRKRRTRDL